MFILKHVFKIYYYVIIIEKIFLSRIQNVKSSPELFKIILNVLLFKCWKQILHLFTNIQNFGDDKFIDQCIQQILIINLTLFYNYQFIIYH